MIGKWAIIVAWALIAVSTAASVQAVTVSASVDRQEAGLGDPITLKITMVGKGGSLPDPQLPDLSAFAVYSSGRSQNISIVNGAFSSALDISYVLVPRKVGEFIIGPIMVRDSDGMASTDPIKITVKQQSGAGASPQAQQPRRNTPPPSPEKGGDFFIDQVVDKPSLFVGEQVILTFRFYQAQNLWDQPSLEWPKYAGFTVEDLPPGSPHYEIVKGKRYLVTEIKRALFPLQSGRLSIDTPQLTIKPDDFGSAFDPFSFFDRDLRELFRRGQPKILTTSPVALNVKPLPENGKPDNFAGAVGRFTIGAQTDKDSVGVDEPITLKVLLSGVGNIRSLPPVKLPELPDFRIYDSGNTESVSNNNQVISGAKTFEQAIIPKTSGRFTIPSIDFSYFDPGSASYKTVATKPIEIIATGEGLVDVGGAPKNIITGGKQLFGYIITDFPRRNGGVDLASGAWFWLLQGIPAIAIVAALFYRTRSKRLLADRGYARRISSSKRLRSIFKAALVEKEKHNYAEFYGRLYDAVTGFVADHLNLEQAGITIDGLRNHSEIPDDVRGQLIAFLERCQSARFAPGGSSGAAADKHLSMAEHLVNQLAKRL